MSIIHKTDPVAAAKVIDFVLREREQSLSAREWQHRLAGYGYSIRDTEFGQVVETLPHRVEIGVLPAATEESQVA